MVDRPEHISVALYRDYVAAEMRARGVTLVPFAEDGPVPGACDVVWDPGLGMRVPPVVLERVDLPIVATVHGLRSFEVGLEELQPPGAARDAERRLRERVLQSWQRLAPRAGAVLTTSTYVARQTHTQLGVRSCLSLIPASGTTGL